MKKLLIIALFSMAKIAFSQDEKFTGIGIFKIGSDTSMLYNYATETKSKVKVINTLDELLSLQFGSNSKIQIVRREHNKNYVKNDITLSYCPDVKEFYITKYEVAGITIKKIKLKYYQNKLVQFQSEFSQEINAALDAKYGKSILEVKADTVSCLYNLTGITQKLIAKTFNNIWTNGDIEATASLYESYDDHCKKDINELFFYLISDKECKACENEYFKMHINNGKPTIDKSKIKDF